MKSGWLRRIRTSSAMLALAAGVWAQGAGAAEVKNVTAKYVWPWGVGIRYEVEGRVPSDCSLAVTATDFEGDATYTATASALSGDTGREEGIHLVFWDLEKQGVKLQSTNVTFSVIYTYTPQPLYCIIDLSEGPDATAYPVSGMNSPPAGGFNKPEYKTTKLVLRRVKSDYFTMGSTNMYNTIISWPPVPDFPAHSVLLESYYIGIFEVTAKQYQLVTGEPLSGDTTPASYAWNTIRGNGNWPASSEISADSFMGRLRRRTGLAFDLPTEAQWECACRAGTTSLYNNGGNTTEDLKKLGWVSANGYTGSPTYVGRYQPNAWGLYDMHGNEAEWCLDWYESWNKNPPSWWNPVGPSSGQYRVLRGGSYISSTNECHSCYRDKESPWSRNGFRLVRTLSD